MQTSNLMLTKCESSHHFLQMSEDHINFLFTDEIFATLGTHVVRNHFLGECYFLKLVHTCCIYNLHSNPHIADMFISSLESMKKTSNAPTVMY